MIFFRIIKWITQVLTAVTAFNMLLVALGTGTIKLLTTVRTLPLKQKYQSFKII